MKRLAFLGKVLEQEGALYRWGSKGSERFDCSGLVTYCLREVGGPDLRATHNSAKMFEEWAPTDSPKPGDVAFYGVGKVSHVVVCVGDGRIIGANGGNSTTTTDAIAAKQGARVKFKPSAKYRPDFRGYRTTPGLD